MGCAAFVDVKRLQPNMQLRQQVISTLGSEVVSRREREVNEQEAAEEEAAQGRSANEDAPPSAPTAAMSRETKRRRLELAHHAHEYRNLDVVARSRREDRQEQMERLRMLLIARRRRAAETMPRWLQEDGGGDNVRRPPPGAQPPNHAAVADAAAQPAVHADMPPRRDLRTIRGEAARLADVVREERMGLRLGLPIPELPNDVPRGLRQLIHERDFPIGPIPDLPGAADLLFPHDDFAFEFAPPPVTAPPQPPPAALPRLRDLFNVADATAVPATTTRPRTNVEPRTMEEPEATAPPSRRNLFNVRRPGSTLHDRPPWMEIDDWRGSLQEPQPAGEIELRDFPGEIRDEHIRSALTLGLLRSVTFLGLRGKATLTDDVLRMLVTERARCSRLVYLNISHTNLSEAAIEEFNRQRPNVEIFSDTWRPSIAAISPLQALRREVAEYGRVVEHS